MEPDGAADGGADAAVACSDPGPVDLDGDQVGWLCDPEESTTLVVPNRQTIAVHLHDHTASVFVPYKCVSGQCQFALFGVGPHGTRQVTSESTAVADDWMNNGFAANPYVSAHGHVYVAPSAAPPTHGTFDLQTGSYTARFGGHPWRPPLERNGEVLAVQAVVMSGTSYVGHLLAPQPNGDLATVGTMTDPFNSGSEPDASAGTPSAVGIPVTDAGNVALARWTAGNATWSIVMADGAPLTGLSKLARIDGNNSVTGFCALRAGVAYLVFVQSGGNIVGPSPSSTCDAYATFGSGSVFIRGDLGISYVHQGMVRMLTGPIPDFINFESVPGDVPVVIVQRQSGVDVWAVDATGSPVRVAAGLDANGFTKAVASSSGTTVHVVGQRGANMVVARFRSGSSPVETPIPDAFAELASVLTTHEGAALISTSYRAFVVPSQTMAVSTINLANVVGAVRGNFTVIAATRDWGLHPTSQRAIYAYDEVAGAPRLTTLSPESYGQYMRALDAPQASPSPWFVYYTASTCSIAKVTSIAGVPTLGTNVTCVGGHAIRARGLTSNGDLVVDESGSEYGLYVLADTTATKVYESQSFNDAVLIDDRTNHVYGWFGKDAQNAGFICLASHPDRCWRTEGYLAHVKGHWGATGQPDSLFAVFVSDAGSNMKLNFVRSIGTGTRPAP